MTANELNNRIARLEGLLDTSTAEDALREAEKWIAQGETRFARLALIQAKSIQARTMLNTEIADENAPRG
jgi:Tfp pilus assembly protein PilX